MSEPLDDFLDPVDDVAWRPAREIFARLGYVPLPPARVDEFQLRGRLWEFIHALAGRGFFLHHTNHLSDRELYTWLHDQWFPEETADVPPGAGSSCHIDLTEALADDGETFLRYYASEADREIWDEVGSGQPLPPHEDPPFDRDRFLPGPWPGPPAGLEPLEDEADDLESVAGMEAEDGIPGGTAGGADSRGGSAVDAAAGTGGGGEAGQAGEAVWERPWSRLRRAGARLVPPAELTDETLPASLWELLDALRRAGWQAQNTDHLSDREVYEILWTVGLRQPARLPGDPRWGKAWMHDLLAQAGARAPLLWLIHYADEDSRAAYARSHPGDALPAPAPRPYSRDWRLPR
ncbi:MAG: hypothetical protein ACKO3N_21200 [Verrucomicrobiota bacterium]